MNKRRALLLIGWIVSVAAAFLLGRSLDSSDGDVRAKAKSGAANRDAKSLTNSAASSDAESGPIDIPNLVASARQETIGFHDSMTYLRAMAPFAKLDAAQAQEALNEARRAITDPEQRAPLYQVLLSRWAEIDGAAAMTYAQKDLLGEVKFDRGVRASVMDIWSKREPDAAWKWYLENFDKMGDPLLAGTLNGAVFRGMAARDLEIAVQRVALVDESRRTGAVTNIASRANNDAARRRLMELTSQLAPTEQTQLRRQLITNWTISNRESAEKWIRDLPAGEQRPMRDAAGTILLSMDPLRGAELMLEGSTEQEKPDIYRRIMMYFASSDPAAASAWLKKQPQGPELDLARLQLANKLTSTDPVAAMTWAKEIQNQESRTREVGGVYRRWRVNDPAAAETAVDAAGLPPEQLRQLKGSVSPTPTIRK